MENKLQEMTSEELASVNGGWVGAALGILGGVALLAYGAGYLYGKLTCEQSCEN